MTKTDLYRLTNLYGDVVRHASTMTDPLWAQATEALDRWISVGDFARDLMLATGALPSEL